MNDAPKLFLSLRDYNLQTFLSDLVAGITVGLVALPLAMAFAISSGVSPQAGLYTAIIAGFLISALGGSKTQIGGPTGAFVVIVYGIVLRHGIDGLVLCTVMAGVLLVILGATGLGSAVRFIPRPVIVGFTNGIAVLIASTQIKDFFGLKIAKVPGDFVGRIESIARHFHTLSIAETTLGIIALALILICLRYLKRVPGGIVALAVGTALVYLMELPVETIGSRFGGIPSGLPHFALPVFHWSLVQPLISPAITVAILGAIESLLSAVVSDRMSNDKHNPNMELVAQGIANIVSPLFGGIPATGAIARTATNVKNGGRTPVAGITHAMTLLLITLFFGRWAGLIPMAGLAAILVVVAYSMSEWRTFVSEFRAPKSDVAVLLTTFLLTVLVDLTVAIEVGMVLAAFLFMRRMAEVTNISVLTHEFTDPVDDFEHDPNAIRRRVIPEGVQVYEITGPFFFGAAEMFKDRVARIAGKPKVLILRLRHVPAIDSTGLHALRELVQRSRNEGILVILSDVHAQPVVALERSGLYDELSEENIHGNIDDALNRAREALGLPLLPRPEFAIPTVARESQEHVVQPR